MTTTVTVKTYGHTVIVTTEPMHTGSFKNRELLMPGVQKDFTVHDSCSLHIEELPSNVVKPPEDFLEMS